MHLTILGGKVSILSPASKEYYREAANAALRLRNYLERKKVPEHGEQEKCVNADEQDLLLHFDLLCRVTWVAYII